MTTSLILDTCLEPNPPDPPDLTSMLDLGSNIVVRATEFSVVHRCLCKRDGKASIQVAVKLVLLPAGFGLVEKNEFQRRMKRELGVWKRLDHPNIVQFLGITCGKNFASSNDCIVSMWMENGTLFEYVEKRGNALSLSDRMRLIRGSAAGLEYLHSRVVNHGNSPMQGIVHGDLHPGNILIDDKHNARLTDFGLSQTLSSNPVDRLAYLNTRSARPGAALWAAPELQHPDLYSNLKERASLFNDIYSLGCIFFYILSGQCPWQEISSARKNLRNFQNPPRPVGPVNMPDSVWNFIEKCWSPKYPERRPSSKDVLSFCTDKLEQLLRPSPASIINVVLFGAVGSGKSSIINLLADKEVAQVSSDMGPCTGRPRWFQLFIGENQFRLWDTVGFLPRHDLKQLPSHLLPYEYAHAVLRNLPEGVSLILLCADKKKIAPSLGHLYWLLNDFLYGGGAPIALVLSHFDLPGNSDTDWWERNERDIVGKTGIPIQYIPHARISTLQAGYDQSKASLKALLQTYAAAIAPIPLRLDLQSYPTASTDLERHCKLKAREATKLIEKFRRPLRTLNVVFFGETRAERSSIISFITGNPVAKINPTGTVHSYSGPCMINTGIWKFRVGVVMEASKEVSWMVPDLADREGGIDALVLCKRFNQPTTREELDNYGSIDQTICKGKGPVAVVVTNSESPDSTDRWWEMSGKDLVKSVGRRYIGRSCIPSLASYHPDSIKLDKTLVESRLSIETLLEDCISSGLNNPLSLRAIILSKFPWLTKEQAI